MTDQMFKNYYWAMKRCFRGLLIYPATLFGGAKIG